MKTYIKELGKLKESKDKAFESVLRAIDAKAKFEIFTFRTCALTGLSRLIVEKHLDGLTEFEMETVIRALSVGKFSPAMLNINLICVVIHLFKNGQEIYHKQMNTAAKIYNALRAEMNVKIQAGNFSPNK